MQNLPRLFRNLSPVALSLACVVGLSSVAFAQTDDFQDLLKATRSSSAKSKAEPAAVTFTLLPADAKPGDTVTFAVTIQPAPNSYTYSLGKAGAATRIDLKRTAGLESLGEFSPDHPPKKVFDSTTNMDLEKYENSVTWSKEFRIAADAELAKVAIEGELNYQICDNNKGTCLPLSKKFAVSLKPSPGPKATSQDRFFYEVTPGKAGQPQPVTLRVQLLVPPGAKKGDPVKLNLSAKLEKGWHTYSFSQKENSANVPTEINLNDEELRGLKALDPAFIPDRAPEVLRLTPEIEQEVYHDSVTWSRRFELLTDPASGDIAISGSITYQVCDARKCLPSRTVSFQLPAPGAHAAAAVAVPEEVAAATPVLGEKDLRKSGLMVLLGSAFLAGFASLLTPCVFPMIPITVSVFLKQAEKTHHRPVLMALVYCGSIIMTFTVLGMLMSALFGATKLNELANNAFLNLFLAAVLVFFGFNLLGMFEIRIPSSLLTYTAGKESMGGYFGIVFMAITFTLTSFTCTFGFLGLILVWAAQGDFLWPILGLLAFSTAFALPFFFLALFPSYLRKLPKSGGWMNSVKVIMGLIELAFVFKFLSVADTSWNGMPTLFDYHLVMSGWMVISITAGLYLLGFFRLPHDVPSENIGVLPLFVAMTFLGLASYLGVGLYGSEKPNGWMWNNIAAFAPPSFESGEGPGGPFLIGKHDQLKYLLDFEKGVQEARRQDQPIFVDFTGVNCINCRLMEIQFAQPDNRELLDKFVRIQLYTDAVPGIRDPKRGEKIKAENIELQEKWFQDASLPGYAVATPDGKTILARFVGLAKPNGEFAAFLNDGLIKWQQRQARAKSPVREPGAQLSRTP